MTGTFFAGIKNLFKSNNRAITSNNNYTPKPIKEPAIPKQEKKYKVAKSDGSPRGIAFFIRMQKRRAKRLMCINTNRRARNLFAYS